MQRESQENFEKYKFRRQTIQKFIKNRLKGRWFYKTQNPMRSLTGGINTPYVNSSKKPETKSFTETLRDKKGYSEYLNKGVFNV